MPIRLSGMNSGLDTEALVTELVSAYKKKGETYKKEQTKLSWTQDAWKSLNTKIYNFYKKASDLRFTNAYTTKKTTVSDTTKATVTASNSTINGTQTLSISNLAKSAYLTGGELKNASGSTKLSELGFNSDEAGTVRISGNGVTKDLSLTKDMTVNDFVKQINDSGTGVKASFDSSSHRLFITSSKSGEANDFTLTGLNEKGGNALYALGVNVASNTSSAEAKAWISYAGADDNATTQKITDAVNAIIDAKQAKQTATGQMEGLQMNRLNAQGAVDYLSAVKSNQTAENAIGSSADASVMSKLLAMSSEDAEKQYILGADNELHEASEEERNNSALTKYSLTTSTTGEGDAAVTTYTFNKNETSTYSTSDKDIISALKDYTANAKVMKEYSDAANTEGADSYKMEVVRKGIDDLDSALAEYQQNVTDYDTEIQAKQSIIDAQNNILSSYSVLDSDSIRTNLTDDEKTAIISSLADKATYFKNNYAQQADGSYAYTGQVNTDANKVDGEDAKIKLNGVTFKSNTNSFNINGLSIQAQGVTTSDLTITTATDTDGIYNKFKDFLSEYNSLLKEMSTLYNASSSKGYEPLTSDEKYALSDKEVEEWETKIKSSLLRKDSTLGSLMSTMTTSMSSIFEVNGKKYGLASLGIKTGGYFSSSVNDRNLLHIDGDSDDDTSSGNADKLRAMLESDPDTAIEIFKQATTKLYESLDKKMKSTSMRTAYTVYNDKEMGKNYSDYTKKIAAWDDKVASIEDSYYKKFAAMETALAKLQSQTSSISGLFG